MPPDRTRPAPRSPWVLAIGVLLVVGAVSWRSAAWGEDPKPGAPGEVGGTFEGTVRVRGVASQARIELRPLERFQEWPAAGAPLLSDTTDEKGRFHVERIPKGLYEVRSHVAGVVPGYSYARSNGRETLEVPVSIPGGPHTLAGRAHWPDGRPFRGTILLTNADWFHGTNIGTQGGTHAETDAEGRFVFAGIGPGTVSLQACVGETFTSLLGRFWIPLEGTLDLDVAAERSAIRGRVLDGTSLAPIVGARVKGGDWLQWHGVRTDAQGAYEVLVPRHERYVSAWMEGFSTRRVTTGLDASQVDLRLARGLTLRGRVLAAPDGAPVKGARVWCVQGAGDSWTYDIHTATSDADGAYVLENVSPGEPMVFAWGGGWASQGMNPFEKEGSAALRFVLDAKAPKTHDLRVVPTLAARVRVLDATGSPVPDADVTATPSGSSYSFLSDLAFDGLSGATTDATGLATLTDFVPGLEFGLHVAASGYWSHDLPDTHPVPGAAEPVEVRLPERRFVDVRVVQEGTGRPIRGASLTPFVRSSSTSWDNDIAARWVTDADGWTRMGPLPQGELGIQADSDLHVGGETRPIATDGPATLTLAVGGFIEAAIVGEPALEGRLARVKLESVELLTVDLSPDSFTTYGTLAVPVGGRYHSMAVRPGTYDLSAEVRVGSDVYEGRVRCHDGAPDVVLRLERAAGRTLRLRVLDPAGQPVPRASALAYREEASRGFGSGKDAAVLNGTAQIELDREEGGVVVEVWGAADAEGRPLGLGAATAEVPSVGEEPVEIRLPRERRVKGTVRTEERTPLAGVQVFALPDDGKQGGSALGSEGRAHAEATSGPDGSFELAGLGAFPYSLRCAEHEGFATAEPIRIGAGSVSPVTFRFERGMDVALLVTDEQGVPLPDARLWVWWRTRAGQQHNHQGKPWGWQVGPDGRVTVTSLVPGRTYNLSVRPPATRPDLGEVDVDPWNPADGTITLRSVSVLKGRVLDHQDVPVPFIGVAMEKAEHSWQTTETDQEGRFSFDEAPAEGALVHIWTGFPGPDAKPTGTLVKPGDDEAVLRVDGRRLLRLVCDDPVESAIPLHLAPGKDAARLAFELSPRHPSYVVDLDPDTNYVVYCGPAAGGKQFLATGVRPGGPALHVKLVAGLSITGHVRGLRHVKLAGVWALGDGLRIPGTLQSDGSFEIPALPPGTTWQIEAFDASRFVRAPGTHAPGETIDIDLK